MFRDFLLAVVLCAPFAKAAPTSPNVVIIFTDDQGYADVGVFGAKGFHTPNLDRMAAEGRKFTNFHVSQPVCSASRAALLTGCSSNRIGIHNALGPRDPRGIADSEMTLAQLFKQKGYATGMAGKWHRGRTRRGKFGVPPSGGSAKPAPSPPTAAPNTSGSNPHRRV